jgi:hypothetical protein
MAVLHAGVPYTVPVPTPTINQVVYATVEMRLYRVRYLGTDGQFDRITIHKFEWLEGPRKGEVQSSYSQSFWRKPSRLERLIMWEHELLDYERNKLRAGLYPGLKLADYVKERDDVQAS